MARFTRHELKEDRFAAAAKETVSWATEHEKSLLTTFVVVLLIVGVLAGGWFYFQKREADASLALGQALRTYSAPIVPAGTPVPAEIKTYASVKERAQAARQQFLDITKKYRWSRSEQVAKYFAGLTAIDTGDSAAAEQELKEVAGVRNQELASLAKFALASLYRNSGRGKEAIQAYNDLIQRPTNSVPKSMAQLELAEVYAPQQPLEAVHIYEQIQRENPATPAAQIAGSRLASLQKQAQP